MTRTPSEPCSNRSQADVVFSSFSGKPEREFYWYVPHSAHSGSEVIILVHGIARNAAEHAFRFRDLADRSGAILVAPLYSKKQYGQYQQLVDLKQGTRADLALLEILDEVTRLTGVCTGRVHLFGYSGGAQFIHRFAMVYPERAASMAVASAGWYTMPDLGHPYPMGIATHPIPGMEFDPHAFLAVDRNILVGGVDRVRDETLRTSKKLDALQGFDRVERAERWFNAMEKASAALGVRPTKSTFEIIEGVGHSFSSSARRGSLPSRVMNFIFPGLD